jgi:DMSO reductase anchor subunit
MHPAYSVILFTTASGAGYGLLLWLALLAVLDDLPADPTLGVAGLGLAFALIGGGLLSSTAHLGRPERAWRAFSQWRSSWLSREGVAAVVTFVPAGLYALAWVFLGENRGIWSLVGLATAAMAMVTVWCTGMIYQSLPTIRAWHQGIVTPVYIVLALATGGVLALTILRGLGHEAEDFGWLVVALLALAWLMKRVYWSYIDAAPRDRTAGAATGLGRFGKVRPLEAPHTQANFVMREMGYTVARKHAAQLRLIVQIVGFALPLVVLALSLWLAPSGALGVAAALVALAGVGIGVVVERWLFFAEAQHVVTVYYGAQAA